MARSSSTISTRPCMASAAPEEAGEIARQRDGRPREPAERDLHLPPGVRRSEERGPVPLEDAVARPVDRQRAEDEREAPDGVPASEQQDTEHGADVRRV